MENEFPPNSHASREGRPARRKGENNPQPRRELAPVTKGKVTRRKKPLRKKFIESFTGDDNRGVLEYIVLDVFAQGLRDAIADTGIRSIERIFYGENGGPSRRGPRGSYTSYRSMSGGSRNRRERDDRDDRRRPSSRRGSAPEMDEFIYDSRVEADHVLDQLNEMISIYDTATVRDLLSLSNMGHEYTDSDWGWTDLRGARVHNVGGGQYLLDLPNPESLN